MSILLGFSIPHGNRVEIPDEGHAAFFGQTQLSGKTTLIEAITSRAPENVKTVAFITKRGEGSFLTGRVIPPYFSEPTNDPEQPLWRWVSAILEASQQRKLRFEEAWIIRACEEPNRARSLADVHENIKVLLDGQGEHYEKGRGKKKKREWRWFRKPVTGINQGIYTSLKAYFDIVMPQLERMPYTKTLQLRPGLNVMDLREYSMEAQGMVIRSVMEYVYRRERNTRVVVPEAQDFVPQGKNSPVKMACETLIRKGAADKNFMWLDSQDMAAVDKVMLRAVSILGVGVQGEAHEMGRAIAHLFGAATRLTPRDIGSLTLGQFFLRLAGGAVTKVYVQPAWMDSEIHARAIATGQESVSTARQILRAFKGKMVSSPAEPAPPQLLQQQIMEVPEHESGDGDENERDFSVDRDQQENVPAVHDSARGDNRNAAGNEAVHAGFRDGTIADGSLRAAPRDRGRAAHDGIYDDRENRDRPEGYGIERQRITETDEAEDRETMWKEKYEALEAEHKILIEAHDALAEQVGKLKNEQENLLLTLKEQTKQVQTLAERNLSLEKGLRSGADADSIIADSSAVSHESQITNHESQPSNGHPFTPAQLDSLFQHMKSRAIKDPGFAELLIRRPELRVRIERHTVEMDGKSLAGSLAILIHEKFFDSIKPFADVRTELIRRGFLGNKAPNQQISQAIKKLVEMGFLTNEATGYQAVEQMKVSIV